MDVIVKNFGKKYNLLGNINPPLMMTSTYDEWLTLCKDNIEIGKEAKKYMPSQLAVNYHLQLHLPTFLQ